MVAERRVLVTGGSGFIGTATVDRLIAHGWKVTNLDKAPPKLATHNPLWRRVDLMDGSALATAVQAVAPTAVVHLAARADTESDRLEDYGENTRGTDNLLTALAELRELQRTVLTSTQFVLRPGLSPTSDTDFAPHTAYGQSKVMTEQALRCADLAGQWVIIRPTNIWGPWHPRYPYEFWRVLSRGLYWHPSGGAVPRSYGYVGTVAAQIHAILEAPTEAVARRVFYVGDPPIMLEDWVNAFSMALTGRKVRVVPLPLLKVAARVGDGVQRLGRRAPLTSPRLVNMTEPHIVPMEPTFTACGASPYTLQQGVEETVKWLAEQGFPVHGQSARKARTFSIRRWNRSKV